MHSSRVVARPPFVRFVSRLAARNRPAASTFGFVLLACLLSGAPTSRAQGGRLGADRSERRAAPPTPPLLRRVVLEGNTRITDAEVEKVLDLEPLEAVDPTKLQRNAEKISQLYVDEGFYRTKVSWELRPAPTRGDDGPSAERPGFFEDIADRAWDYVVGPFLPDDEFADVVVPRGRAAADVVYRIDEGTKVKVLSIEIIGNERIATHELRDLLSTKESVPLADLLGWGLYREDALGKDLRAIGAHYEDQGFLDVKVGPPVIDLSADERSVRLRIPVREGKQYRLGRIRIGGDHVVKDERHADEGAVVFEEAALLARLGVKEGGVAGRGRIAAGLQGIAKRYQDRGYAYANVVPETKVDDETDRIDIFITVDAGPRVRIERVRIVGQEKTADHVIRRELRLYEGDWFSAEQLLRSEARVRALGYFKSVRVLTDQGSAADRVVVTFEVEEKNTGIFQLGAGYSSGDGFVFNGQIAYDNFLGLGQSMSAAAQLSGRQRQFDLRFSEPHLFLLGQDPISFSIRGFNSEIGFGDFTRSATGGQLVLGYPMGRPFSFLTDTLAEDAPSWLRPYVPDLENLKVFASLGAERVLINSPDIGYLPGLDHTRPRYTTALETGIIFDQRNNRLFPSAGYFLEARAEFATPALGAELLPEAEARLKKSLGSLGWAEGARALDAAAGVNSFQRFTLNGRFYLALDEVLPIRGVVAKANVELGYLRSDGLLPFENYYAGGLNSVRGYLPLSLSPVATVETPDGARTYRIGGNKEILANVELEFPILQQLGIRGVLFFDAGNAFGEDENLFYLGDRPLSAEGWDARRDLPLGLYSSVGFGVRWFSPIGPLRFEWGIPLSRRPPGTPGMSRGDQPVLFEFGIGGAF